MNSASRPSQKARHSLPAVDGMGASLTDFAVMNFEATDDLEKLAEEILEDPIALQELGDRVFDLLKQDVRAQQERHDPYRRR
ncbi:MAG: hypothetical protein F6K42_08370 [Leptolyngbya sp. SIO1D8]|nr:hypothetical protein [Leptolyngbya sp. SIO1D8]